MSIFIRCDALQLDGAVLFADAGARAGTVHMNSKRLRWLLRRAKLKRISALMLLSPVLVCAQPVQQAEPTVITVTGQATPLSATSASVVVLPRQAIEDGSSENATDLLRQLPFLFIAQSGARGGLTTITLRGGKQNFTAVMFDGIPLNDITNVLGGSYDFSTMSTDAIEQIEIVRGPLSSVYGSGAVAGVVNIIPRRGEGTPSFELGGTFGNFFTRDGSFAAIGKIRNSDYSFAGSYLDIGEQVKNDPYKLATLSLSTHHTFDNDKLLRFVSRYQNAEASGLPPGGGGPEFSILQTPQAVHTIEIVGGTGWQQQVNQTWLYSLQFDVFDRRQGSNVPPLLDAWPPTSRSFPAEVTDTEFKRYRFGFANTLHISANLTAEVNAAWRREEGDSRGSLAANIPDNFSLDRNDADVGGVLIYSTHGLTSSAGLRVDKTSVFRSVYSPQFGLSYRIKDRGPRFKASWGRGFKIPSFYAIADKIVGNPLLKPEFSRSFDLGIEHTFLRGHLRGGLTVFRNYYTDLVDFSAAVFRLVNRSQTRTQGGELALTMPVNSRLELGAYASYLEWRVQNNAEPLRDIPHWQSGSNINWKIAPRWHSLASVVATGRRYDFQIPVPQQTAVGGYSSASLAVTYDASERLTVFARADNLLDHHYHEYIGFPNPGVYARLGVRYRFR
jgi:outer membrane cobalamin receptor